MIKGIIFDFDGVILDSANIKTEAFRELFLSYTDDVDEIMQYHKENSGYSRYIKFEYFFTHILNQPYDEMVGENLSKKFNEITMDRILKAPKVYGIESFLSSTDLKCFIATGTPQDDIVMITKKRELYQYFDEMIGTPTKKTEAVKYLMERYHLKPDELVFVGDAESDERAANETGLSFIPRLTDENRDVFGDYEYRIDDFMNFYEMILKIQEAKNEKN